MAQIANWLGEMAAMLPKLMNGRAVTVQIFVVTLVFSLPLGLLVSFGRMAKNPVIRWITKAYISIMRGTPLMLQLFIVYFGPYYIFRIRVTNDYRLWAVFIGCVINYSAYCAEIYRSGIQSMPVGQYEAAKLLGYNRFQTFFKIIFPQVIKRILPSVTNEVITLVKDTSLANTIGVVELIRSGETFRTNGGLIWPFFYTAVFYLVFVGALTILFNLLEKKLNYFRV